jgi:hypothetical protein
VGWGNVIVRFAAGISSRSRGAGAAGCSSAWTQRRSMRSARQLVYTGYSGASEEWQVTSAIRSCPRVARSWCLQGWSLPAALHSGWTMRSSTQHHNHLHTYATKTHRSQRAPPPGEESLECWGRCLTGAGSDMHANHGLGFEQVQDSDSQRAGWAAGAHRWARPGERDP